MSKSRKRPLPTGYTMLFKPTFGSTLPIGYLNVTIIGANDLLALDGPLLKIAGEATSDPYTKIFLDDNDQMTRTQTIPRNCHPKWDYKTSLNITNGASILYLNVYDEEVGLLDNLSGQALLGGSPVDKHLGTLTIPLATLPINQIIEGWFALSAPVDGATKSSSSSSTATKPELDAPYGRIMLRLHYETSLQAQFYAGFLPPPPVLVAPPIPFSADVAYQNLNRTLEYLWPILDCIYGLMDIRSWTSPLRSVLFLMAWFYLCRNYQWIPIVMHVSLIVKMSISYVRMFIYEHPHGACKVDKLKQTIQPIIHKKVEETSIGNFLDKVATFLIGKGLAGTLQTTQNVLGNVSDGLDGIVDLLQWKNRATSKNLFIGLFVSIGLFMLIPFHYWLLCGSIWMMTSNTYSYAVVVYTMSGLIKSRQLKEYEGIKKRLPSLIRVRKVKM